ncbi:alpha/beta hydrolase [Phenylobacterium aquaticum]|uniref:alpha/beta hydrolase n=1 Tax=Phenylobacterium aquaticum TaxID=1763816 RepID=UPI001F5CAD38|nr:alpha/beta hydrolase [Phenylobacterium aquaticum]
MSRTRHLVDPQLLPLLDSIPPFDLSEAVLPMMRARPARFAPAEADLAATEMVVRYVPGPAGAPDVGVVIYRPKAVKDRLPCIFHIHGGGYVTGSASANEAVHRSMTAELGCCIISVEYRLAPETRFPGAVEDCYVALSWVFANAAELGVDPARVGIMGESAGGGLAASLALLVRDRAEYRLAFQHLIYPMIDDRTCVTADPHPHVGEFVWTPQANHFGWSCLLGFEPGGEGVSPYAAAARAKDVAGLPPTYIATGSLDLFLEEDLAYAQRLIRAGVPVELHVYPGAFHGFQWAPEAEVSRIAARDARAALAKAMA